MVSFKRLDPGEIDSRDFPFSAKESPHDKKVTHRVGSGLMFGGDDAVFDELFEVRR